LTWSHAIFRFSIYHDIVSTGIITDASPNDNPLSDWEIYGNLFFWDEAFANSSESWLTDGVIAMLGENMTGYMRVYNNTIANIHHSSSRPCGYGSVSGHLFGHRPGGNVTMYVYNNLAYNSCSGNMPMGGNTLAFTGTMYWDYQIYYSNDGSVADSSAHTVVTSGNPFVNSAANDFRLATATSAGNSTLGSPYNVDLDGRIRGLDGTWDRGAYEFGGTTNPPVISAVTSGSISDRTATITWTTDKPANSVVQYGLTTSYGSSSSNATLLTSHAITLANLNASTAYHYRVLSYDSAGLSSTSSDSTFTTQAPDTVPPTVSVTSPSAGALVAGTTALTATASDNGAVAGVQFLVDGQAAGAEVTSAPYSYNWNSTLATNGTHAIQARARDAAGNTNFSTAVSVQVQNVVPSGLAGYWTFDEGSGTQATDSSGSGGTGTLLNGAAWGTGRVGGSALLLNGVNASVSVPDASALRMSGDLTIAIWVKHSSLPAVNSWMYYVEKGQDNSKNYSFGAYSDSAGASRLFFEFVDATSTYRYYPQSSGLTLSIGVWTRVAVVVDRTNGQLRFYQNGQQVSSTSLSPSLRSTTDPLTVGQQNLSGYTFPMNGLLDDLRIYNRALSPSEVTALASIGNPQPPAPSNLRVLGLIP